MPFEATLMDLEIIILSKKKLGREKRTSYDITYKQNLKFDTNEHIYKVEIELTDIENRLVVAKREEGSGGEDWDTQVVLYSAGNYI